MKRLTRFLWKHLYCRFFHWRERCYPQSPDYWHCHLCHPCDEELLAAIYHQPFTPRWL